MTRELRLLLVEQGEGDGLLIAPALLPTFDAAQLKRVDTRAKFLEALDHKQWDAILVDCDVPGFAATEALVEGGRGVPMIFVSWGLGEAVAVAAMKAGASDCLLKSDLNRLAPALARALREAGGRRVRAPAKLKAADRTQPVTAKRRRSAPTKSTTRLLRRGEQ